jgi:hypothetical protein
VIIDMLYGALQEITEDKHGARTAELMRHVK